jgi:hypothetical protein
VALGGIDGDAVEQGHGGESGAEGGPGQGAALIRGLAEGLAGGAWARRPANPSDKRAFSRRLTFGAPATLPVLLNPHADSAALPPAANTGIVSPCVRASKCH